MWTLISRVRRKPAEVRRNIAIFTALGMTAVIVLFWLASFAARGSETTKLPQESAEQTDTLSPFRSFAATISAVVSDTRRQLAEFKKFLPALSSETVYPKERSPGESH